MKRIINIISTFSLSCLMVSALVMVALNVKANDVSGEMDNNNDKFGKKTDVTYRLTAMPKTNLSLDAGFKANGFLNNAFKLSSDNTTKNVKSVVTYKKGNVTYILPYSVQVQPQVPVPQPVEMQYHHLQIKLPFRKG